MNNENKQQKIWANNDPAPKGHSSNTTQLHTWIRTPSDILIQPSWYIRIFYAIQVYSWATRKSAPRLVRQWDRYCVPQNVFPVMTKLNVQGAQKIGTIKLASFLYVWTSSNINRFSKFFHCQNQEKICNITKDPTTPQVCRYSTLWNISVLKATIETRRLL